MKASAAGPGRAGAGARQLASSPEPEEAAPPSGLIERISFSSETSIPKPFALRVMFTSKSEPPPPAAGAGAGAAAPGMGGGIVTGIGGGGGRAAAAAAAGGAGRCHEVCCVTGL